MADKTTFVTNLYIGHHLLYCFAILEDYGGFCPNFSMHVGQEKIFLRWRKSLWHYLKSLDD